LREVQDHVVLGDTFQMEAHELQPGIGTGDVHDGRRAGWRLDDQIIRAPQHRSRDVEYILARVRACQDDRAVLILDRARRGERGVTI
jgi:hypothetical protein